MMLSNQGSGTRRGRDLRRRESMIGVALLLACALSGPLPVFARDSYQFDDSHFHLTNYVQEGISPQAYLKIMGNRVGR